MVSEKAFADDVKIGDWARGSVYAMRQTTQIFNDIMENAVKQYNITSMPSN